MKIREMHDEPEHRERIRREILELVESRRSEEQAAFSKLTTYMSAALLGGTAASIGYLSSISVNEAVVFAGGGAALFAVASIFFCGTLYTHYQLRSRRFNVVSEAADRFFSNEGHLEDVLASLREHQSRTLFRFIFWGPITIAFLGFVLIFISAYLSTTAQETAATSL